MNTDLPFSSPHATPQYITASVLPKHIMYVAQVDAHSAGEWSRQSIVWREHRVETRERLRGLGHDRAGCVPVGFLFFHLSSRNAIGAEGRTT
jgi:hypothetical protein